MHEKIGIQVEHKKNQKKMTKGFKTVFQLNIMPIINNAPIKHIITTNNQNNKLNKFLSTFLPFNNQFQCIYL